jgi:hypothetical protein
MVERPLAVGLLGRGPFRQEHDGRAQQQQQLADQAASTRQGEQWLNHGRPRKSFPGVTVKTRKPGTAL